MRLKLEPSTGLRSRNMKSHDQFLAGLQSRLAGADEELADRPKRIAGRARHLDDGVECQEGDRPVRGGQRVRHIAAQGGHVPHLGTPDELTGLHKGRRMRA